MLRRDLSARAMFPVIERFLSQQVKQRVFCAEHGLTESKLNYWLARYRTEVLGQPAPAHMATRTTKALTCLDPASKEGFLPIIPSPQRIPSAQQISPAQPASEPTMELTYRHGVTLRLFAPVAPAYLSYLLSPDRWPL